MKKCINCGKEAANNNETICRHCGEKLIEIKSGKCKNCGVATAPGVELCSNCAAQIAFSEGSFHEYNKGNMYLRDSRYRKRRSANPLLIAVCIALSVATVAATTACIVMFSKNKNISPDSDETNVASNSEGRVTEPDIKDSKSSHSPYDYDPDSDDWYRLRKSRNDASSQVGAYKTFEKALSYAEIYVPQGYTLYDKDFNVIRSGSNASSSSNKTTRALYDYDPDSNDWYRLRKSRNDASSQVGAYKTVEKALYYATIYRSRGYILYDKDFNVVE